MSPKYNVGDLVYWASCNHRIITNPCPVCYGNLKVTIILGNGDHVEIPCEYCKNGWEGPTGVEKITQYGPDIKRIIIDGVNTKTDITGEKIEYRYNNYIIYPDNVFDTEEEAKIKCSELINQHNQEELEQNEQIKKNKYKSYAWHVGYHMRNAKEAKKQMEYHEKMAKICKSKVKEKKK